MQAAPQADHWRLTLPRSGGSQEKTPAIPAKPALWAVRSTAWLGRGFVLICQGASQLHGIGTLLQPHDQPVLQGPHVRETRGEPLAAHSGTSRIAAEGDDVFA